MQQSTGAPLRSIMLETPDIADQCGRAGRCRAVCQDCKVRLFAVCGALDDEEIRSLERLARQKRVTARQGVMVAGDDASEVLTLTSGFLQVQRDLANGRRQVVGFAAPGDFIGFDPSDRYQFTVESLTEVTLCRFSRADFSALMHGMPTLLEKLHQTACHELSLAQDHMVLLGRRSADERVALFLINWRAKVSRIFGPSPMLPLPMNRQDIADHLGLTIETVSRIIARMGRQKILLSVPGGLRVLDEAALLHLAPS